MTRAIAVLMMLTLAMLVVTLVGCPTPSVPVVNPPDNPPDTPPVTNSQEAETGPIVVAAQSNVPVPPGAQTGSVRIRMGKSQSSPSKALTATDSASLGVRMKTDAEWVQISFYGQKDDGEPSNRNFWFTVPYVEGLDAIGQAILPGTYRREVSILDRDYQQLFATQDHVTVQIERGKTTTTSAVVEFLSQYRVKASYTVKINTSICSSVEVLDANLDSRGYGFCYWDAASSSTVFECYVPIDFVGGTIVVWDGNCGKDFSKGGGGRAVVCQLVFPLVFKDLDFGGQYHLSSTLTYPVVYDDVYGSLIAVIAFGFEDDYYVRLGSRANGLEFRSIQEAVNYADDNDLPIALYIGEGDYDGFNYQHEQSVGVIGLGPDKTRIINDDKWQPFAVYVAPYNWPYDGMGKSAKAATGGSMRALQLMNLTVENGAGKRDAYDFSDAAVVCDWRALVLDDCVVISRSNGCIAGSYNDFVQINHCDLIGPAAFGGFSQRNQAITLLNESGVEITNSIIVGTETPFVCTNGTNFNTSYCCVYGYNSLGYCFGNPAWQPTTTGFVFADPLLDTDYRLKPASPCVGAAEHGLNIGAIFAESLAVIDPVQ